MENVISVQIKSMIHFVTVVLGSMGPLARSPFAILTRKRSQIVSQYNTIITSWTEGFVTSERVKHVNMAEFA